MYKVEVVQTNIFWIDYAKAADDANLLLYYKNQ